MKQNFNKNLNDIEDIRSGKNKLTEWLRDKDWGYSLEELGLTEEMLNDPKNQHKIDEDETEKFSKDEFRVMNLYQYVSNFYGGSNISNESRDFCKRMVGLTKTNLMSQNDIITFNGQNPGFGKGGGDSYSVFNYRGGTNCKHHWRKFKFDTVSKAIIEAPNSEQQGWTAV